MREVSLEQLLEAGCHFGHQVTRQNPKARDFVYEARDGIHIIDLAKTKEGLDEAARYVKEVAMRGGTLLVVGTKRQAKDIVSAIPGKLSENGVDGMFVVTKRWIGGTLTNFPEVSRNFKKLEGLNEKLGNEMLQQGFTKKEIGLWQKEKQKLEEFYGGMGTMRERPSALFIIDTNLENLAVREALATGVETVGIVDTNADPLVIDYPIPANDDAVGSIQLITDYIVDAWIEGRKKMKAKETEEPKEPDGPKENTVENTVIPSAAEGSQSPAKVEKKTPAKKKKVEPTA